MPSRNSPIDDDIAATNGMSAIVWWVSSAHWGMVISTSAPSSPARRPNTRAVPLYSRYSAIVASTTTGVRTAHSGRGVGPHAAAASMPSGWKFTPSDDIESAWSQKFNTGFEKNQPSCAHQVEIQSSRDSISRATSP
jgi:hypothetical protein